MSDDFGIQPEGFNLKALSDIITEMNDEFKSVYGENTTVTPESPLGQIIGILAVSISQLWEVSQLSFDSYNPSASQGVALSNLVQLNGIVRLEASGSTVILTITGIPATVIPLGSLVSTTDTSLQFATSIEVTIPGGGSIAVAAEAVSTGPNEALTGTITSIDTPITGWATVDNLADATPGSDVETDVELRARRSASISSNAQVVLEAILAAVRAVDGVDSASIIENDTDVIVSGQPAHSFQVVVVGGADQDISDAIFSTKPIGIQSFGTTSGSVTDSQGIAHDIDFSRPTEIPIFVAVVIVKDSDYPITGDDDMKQAIVDYANGILVEGRGFALGDDVVFSRMYTPVNSIPSHSVTSIDIDTSGPPTGMSDIVIAVNEISVFTIANITVNGV